MNQPAVQPTVIKPSTAPKAMNLRMPRVEGARMPTNPAPKPVNIQPWPGTQPIPPVLDMEGITNALNDLLGGFGDGPEFEDARGAISTLQGLILSTPQPTVREVDPGPLVGPGVVGPVRDTPVAAFLEDDLNRREAIALALGRRLGRVL